MNKKSKLLSGSCVSGQKITVREYLKQLPVDAEIWFVDPKEELSYFSAKKRSTTSVALPHADAKG